MTEFRFDLFDALDFDKIKAAREKCSYPVLFTARHEAEIMKLAAFSPDYFDLDYKTPKPFVDQLRAAFPKIKWLISYHNYTETPQNLEELLTEMKKAGGDLYKIACTAQTSSDALRMILFARKHPGLIGICMGEKGEVTRIVLQKPWTFAALSEKEKTAEGQLTREEFNLYGEGDLYGLIGRDLKKRLSHRYHNAVMKPLDCLYVKMPVEPDELSTFLNLCKSLNAKGLSVTDPLKEAVLPFLDEISSSVKEIGACNTVTFHDGKLYGDNTDGKGALDALEERVKVKGKVVTVMGAGGSAKAIIYEALQRGAHVNVWNRTKQKAEALAKKWKISVLDSLEACDVLINTTPTTPPSVPGAFLMDIAVTAELGKRMWLYQAVGQYKIWMPHLESGKVFAALERAQRT